MRDRRDTGTSRSLDHGRRRSCRPPSVTGLLLSPLAPYSSVPSGLNVLPALARGRGTTPILFLTACDDVGDRVRGLDLGGDDYLVKPLAFEEMLARVRALVRRGPAAQPSPGLAIARAVIEAHRYFSRAR
jgi:ActR/RegA family two-component response regulator